MIQDPNPVSATTLSEDAITTELARANLARLRGDYIAAEEQCVLLLQKAPHNANVAALLGDVSVEQGKLEAAVQWYEMAVDSGAAPGIEEKLRTTNDRIKQKEALATEAGIGLPSRTLFSPATILAAVIVVLMLLVGAYVAGTAKSAVKPATSQDQPPITVPSSSALPIPSSRPIDPAPTTIPKADSTPTSASTPIERNVPAGKSGIDADLAPYLGDATGPLARISGAIADPRTHVVTLDVAFQAGDDPRAVAALVAEAALGKLKDAPSLTIRILNNGRAEYLADATRDKYNAYIGSGRTVGTGTELADALLVNEWKAGSEAAAGGR